MNEPTERSSSTQRALSDSDWDFRRIEASEVVACCHYEFARESPSIIAYYDQGCSFETPFAVPFELPYRTRVNGKLIAIPNPWPFSWLQSVSSGAKFADTPWRSLSPEFRREVSERFVNPTRPLETATGYRWFKLEQAFRSADTHAMKEGIISRGSVRNRLPDSPGGERTWVESRDGIDHLSGIERIVVEIDWAAFDDMEIVKAFRKWVTAHRPSDIGFKNRKGRRVAQGWRAKLENLALMRILHACPLNRLEKECPDVWKWLIEKRESRAGKKDAKTREIIRHQVDLYGSSYERHIYDQRRRALSDFRELFPFLPEDETPVHFIK